MGFDKKRKGGNSGRDEGRFVSMPFVILDDPAYQQLSHAARSLLMEFARQYRGDNNGCLLASQKCLAARGWNSADTINSAKRQLIEALFIVETVKGARPNKASWYAMTWQNLDASPKYDAGAEILFRDARQMRKARLPLPAPKSTREDLFARHRDAGKNTRLTPKDGVDEAAIAPKNGVEAHATAPKNGAIHPIIVTPSTPKNGDLYRRTISPATRGAEFGYCFSFAVNQGALH